MIEKIYTVTDLGPGDGGKGSVIQALCAKLHPALVIKEGGAQGSHGVTLGNESFSFSQWGCGTFYAVPTYLSERMVIAPSMMVREAEALRHTGIYDAFKIITASPECLCSTPYHMYMSQIKEMLRGDKPRGTVGSGVGVAYREYTEAVQSGSESFRKSLIHAKDLTLPKLAPKLAEARERAKELTKQVDMYALSSYDRAHYINLCQTIEDDRVFSEILDEFKLVGQKLRLKSLWDMLKDARGKYAVVERSHGVLTDAECGLKPHVSALRTLPCFSEEQLRAAGFKGKIVNIGVHRAYEYRHGAGPMPTAQSDYMTDLPRDENRWQGVARYGYLDTVLLRYALKVCEPTQFDGIALTCMDQVLDHGNWPICRAYKYGNLELDEISKIDKITPITDCYSFDSEYAPDRDAIIKRCAKILSEYIDVPLCMLSFGSTERDKYFLGGISK